MNNWEHIPPVRLRLAPGPLESTLSVWPTSPGTALWRAIEVSLWHQQVLLPPIIDLGCGDGRFAQLVFSAPTQLTGVDLDQRSLRAAARSGLYRDLVHDDLHDLSQFADGMFASAVSNSVFEHVDSPPLAFQAIYRVLRPGGRLFLTVNTSRLSNMLLGTTFARRAGCLGLASRYVDHTNHRYHHVSLYADSKWKELLKNVGFVVEQAIPYCSAATVNAWNSWEEVLHWGIGPFSLQRALGKLPGRWKQLKIRLLYPHLKSLFETDAENAQRSGGACMFYIARKTSSAIADQIEVGDQDSAPNDSQ